MKNTRSYAHIILFIVGIVLMVGGIVTRKYGASVVGLIVAAVNYWQWDAWRKKTSAGDSSRPER